jgi:hypothetical protein
VNVPINDHSGAGRLGLPSLRDDRRHSADQPGKIHLYEAGFTTTGPHPQGGVAIAHSIHDARQRLADMLIFCDPTADATADITAFTPTRTVARYSGTVAELFADLTTGTPDRTVHARPLVGLTTPRTTHGQR